MIRPLTALRAWIDCVLWMLLLSRFSRESQQAKRTE